MILDITNNISALDDMLMNMGKFIIGERAFLKKDSVLHPNLADVVEY